MSPVDMEVQIVNAAHSSHMRSEAERSLADAYADKHERLDNFIFTYALPKHLFSRLGIELHSIKGYTLLFVFFFIGILSPTLLIATITEAWTESLVIRAFLVVAALAILNVLVLVVAQSAAYKISALHRALTNPEQIKSLTSWDRRWYSPSMSVLMGGCIALILLVVVYYLTLSVTGIRLSAVIMWLCAVVAIFLGQFSFSTAMIFVEFRKFTVCRFELFSLSPINTQALQTTSAGLRQLGIVAIIFFPLFLVVLLSVLPEGSNLNVPITAGFLLLGYLATAIGTLFPLSFLGNIVKAEKWRLLEPLQATLNQMVSSVRTMTDDDYEEFTRLQTLHSTISDSKDSLLGWGAITRIVGAVLLSTITVVATSIVQSYLQLHPEA